MGFIWLRPGCTYRFYMCSGCRLRPRQKGCAVLDTIFIAAGIAFFAVSIVYTVVCDRL
jgi:hypothetical protein